MGSLLRSGTHKWTREEEKESMPRTADTHSIVYVRFILRCFYEWIRFFCLAIFLLLLLQPMPSGVTVSWTELVEGKIQRNAFFSVYVYNYHVTITFFVFTQSVRTIFIRLFIFYFIFTTGIDQLQQQFRSLGSLAEDVNFLLLSLVVVVEKKIVTHDEMNLNKRSVLQFICLSFVSSERVRFCHRLGSATSSKLIIK